MSWFKKLISMKTVRKLVPDLLPDLLNAIPHASDPELDLLLQLITAEVKRRIAATHTSSVNVADVAWQPPRET